MLCSPKIDCDGSVRLCLFLRRNFVHSNSRRCESAWAIMVVTSSGESEEEIGLLLLPIVMSAPIVVYGHWTVVDSESIGSGSKLMSNGWADMSRVRRCRRSMSNLEDWRMYPAVANAGWSASAHESRMVWCACVLLMRWQLKAWSP